MLICNQYSNLSGALIGTSYGGLAGAGLSGTADDIAAKMKSSEAVRNLQYTLNAYAHTQIGKHPNLYQPFRFDGQMDIPTVVATWNTLIHLAGHLPESDIMNLLGLFTLAGDAGAKAAKYTKKIIGFFAYLADKMGWAARLWPDKIKKHWDAAEGIFTGLRILNAFELEAVDVAFLGKDLGTFDLSWITKIGKLEDIVLEAGDFLVTYASKFDNAIKLIVGSSLEYCDSKGSCVWKTTKDQWDRYCPKDWTPDGERCLQPAGAVALPTTGPRPNITNIAITAIPGGGAPAASGPASKATKVLQLLAKPTVPAGTIARWHRGEKKFYIFFPKTTLQGIGLGSALRGPEDGTNPDLTLSEMPEGATRGKDIVPLAYSWLFWSAVTVGAAGVGYGIYRWKVKR